MSLIKNLKVVWNRIVSIGTDSCDSKDLFPVKVVNQGVVFILLLLFLDVIGALAQNLQVLYLLPNLILIIASISCFLLNASGRFKYSRIVFVLGISITVLSVTIIYSPEMGQEFALVAMLVLVWILFQRETYLKLLLYSIVALNFFIGVIYMQSFEPIIIVEENIVDNVFIFCATLIMIFSLLSSYRKKQEELVSNLEEKNNMLETKSKELRQFTYAASHDLKTPIRTIVSFLDLASQKDVYSEEERIEFMEYAQKGGRKMYHIVEDLALFSSINSNEKEDNINEIDNLLTSVERSLEPILSRNNGVVQRINTDRKIRGDKQELFILFRNLIKNGILFNNSPHPEVSVKIDSYQDNGIRMEFKDNGIGIDPIYFNQIFDYFKRLQNETITHGNGIGLSLCKKIVSNMNGEIEVESEINKGSTFKIVLPNCTVH